MCEYKFLIKRDGLSVTLRFCVGTSIQLDSLYANNLCEGTRWQTSARTSGKQERMNHACICTPYTHAPHMHTTSIPLAQCASTPTNNFQHLALTHLLLSQVLCLAGRVHAYEGLPFFVLTFITRVLTELGVKLLIATNASGTIISNTYLVISDNSNNQKQQQQR